MTQGVYNLGSRRRRRGNFFVEFGMVVLPFFALIFGIVDYGLAFFVHTTMQHAVRSGVRYGVTWQVVNGMCHEASIREVVRRNSMGFLTQSSVGTYVKIRYYDPVTLAEVTTNKVGNVLKVSVEGYQWGWIAPLWRTTNPYNIVVRSSDRMEGLGAGASQPCK